MNSPPRANQHYYQPRPNTYIPPPVYSPNAYIDLRIYIPAPYLSRHASTKYPSLNPILAADTTLLHFDVKKTPQSQIPVPTYYSNWHIPATVHRASHVRLISKAFPWTIDIIPDAQAPVTCQAVWKALYDALQEPLVDSEWGLIVGVKRLRETVEKAAKKRIEDGGKGEDKRMKRIDFLGEVTLFKGLERDEDFEKMRSLFGEKPCPETWVVKLVS